MAPKTKEASMLGKATVREANGNGRPIAAAEVASYYLPTLIAGILASVGIIVGSSAPWVRVWVISVNGLDVDGAAKATLAIGALSGIALICQRELVRTGNNIRWTVPLTWGAFVAGVACLAVAVTTIVRFTSPPAAIFDEIVGVQVGWGLWLVAGCSPLLSLAAAITAVQVGRTGTQTGKSGRATWAAVWCWAAVVASTGIALYAGAYMWAEANTGVDNAFWLRLFEQLQHLGTMG
jgi:hypothetical protein